MGERHDKGWTGATPSMADSPRSAAGGQPRMLIMDVCGAYLRPLGGWAPIAKFVQLMNELGVDEPATRSALARMRERDLLEPERRHGVRGLRLTDKAMPLLAESDQRIFSHSLPARLADGWVLVSFSIPEQERAKRHLLRSKLSWLGFGLLGNGLWMAPRRNAPDLAKAIEELGYEQYVMTFEATYTGFEELAQLVRRAWNLDELATLYREFLEWATPVAEGRATGRQAFVDYTLSIYHWRKFPYLDPALPAELLPDDWPGRPAAALFAELRARLELPALEYVRST
ncbi:PaaX family transcriptional regulator C-terminal domain-containing protein [Nonomuraea soli]